MVVELGLSHVVSRKAIAKAEKQIAKQYGLDRVCIEPRYSMPDGLTDEYIRSLYDDMAYRMPSARACSTARSGNTRAMRSISRWTR